MSKSFKRDIQLLLKISKNQTNIRNALARFNCDQNNIDNDIMCFDLCSFYLSQIGEASGQLTEETQQSFSSFNPNLAKYFRNKIDHNYESVNKKYLKSELFNAISNQAFSEIKSRIIFCQKKANS